MNTELLRQARISAKLTQKELGILCGFSEKTAQLNVTQWENGYRPIPRKLILKIAEILNLPPESMI